MIELLTAITDCSFSHEKAKDYAMGEYSAPFITFRDGHFKAKEGFEDITTKAIERFKRAYIVESFCSFVKDTISDVSQRINIGKDAGMFLYAALVFRYLHVIEGLGKYELLEVADSMYSY